MANRRAPDTGGGKPELTVRLLGPPQWVVAGRAPVQLVPKDAALLAILALDGAQPQTALCERIWPTSTARQAAANLRQRASRLATAAGVPMIEVGASVRLHGGFAVDLLQLGTSSDDALLSAPVLLAGVDLGDHNELDRWLADARKRVAAKCAQTLADYAEALQQEGRLHEALARALAGVKLGPLSEQGWRRVMKLHYLRGDRAAALEAYWQLHDLLREELGTRPSAETMQLMQTIETAAPGPALPRRPVPMSLIRPPVLVGRRAPWAAMATAWQQAQPFVVVGEAGIGKSRLLEEFVHGQSGVVAERARPGDEGVAGALLARLVLHIEQHFAPPASPATRAELARVQPQLATPPAAPGNNAVFRHALEAWLSAAQERGLRALVIDDLHNVDIASLEALRWLAASPRLSSLRLALASRPWHRGDVAAQLTDWMVDSQRPVRIELLPLAPSEVKELLASLALPALVDESMAQQLYRHAGGQPLYTLATLQHVVAGGVALADVQALPAPASLEVLLDARVRELPEAVIELLHAVAVGGADASVDRAARLLAQPMSALREAWALLEARNVLRGESFSHDLMHEAALRAVPLGFQQELHRRWAALLGQESDVAAGRVARHWELGQRWSEAGSAWHAAATAARRTGRLAEQAQLLANAARCHGLAGEHTARFEALLVRLEALHLQQGAAAAMAAWPEVQALAETTQEHLRCRIAQTEALIDLGRSADAEAESAQALRESQHHPGLAAEVHAQRAIALAHLGQPDAALSSAERAVALARGDGMPARRLKAANALMNVLWSAGRLVQALEAQGEELAIAEATADRATAAASESSRAALLASIGEVTQTYDVATRARKRLREAGLEALSTQVILNQTLLGAAAAALGRFDEALAALLEANPSAEAEVVDAVRAKAMLTLAGVWLTVGRADQAAKTLTALPVHAGPGMHLQSHWLLGRCALASGASAQPHWRRFRQLLAAQAGALPLVQGVAFEASYIQEDPALAVRELRAARSHCEQLGLSGTGRTLAWRELMAWLQQPGAEATRAARALASDLAPFVDAGMSAKAYVPEVWLSLARAHDRAGDKARGAGCRASARAWLAKALARLAPELRAAFCEGNPVNRELLGVT